MGHHWQWPRPIRPYLPRYQSTSTQQAALEPMFRVSTVLRPTGCRWQCRKWSSRTAERPCHSPTAESCACQWHGRTQWVRFVSLEKLKRALLILALHITVTLN